MTKRELFVAGVECETCGSPSVMRLRTSRRHGFRTGRCQLCGMAFAIDRPAEAEVSALYDERGRQERYEARARPQEVAHEGVLGKLDHMLASRSQRDIFDIGAGGGDFLIAAARHG